MKFETRIRFRGDIGLYYTEYRRVYLEGWIKTPWFDLYSVDECGNSLTRCWSTLTEAKKACQKLLDSGKLDCTKDTFFYP